MMTSSSMTSSRSASPLPSNKQQQADHIYSKPPKNPLIKVQLKQRKTKLITQHHHTTPTAIMTSSSPSPVITVDLKPLSTATPIMTSSIKAGSLDVSSSLQQMLNSTHGSDSSSGMDDVTMTPSIDDVTMTSSSSNDAKPPMLCDVKQEPDFTEDLFRSLTPSPTPFEADIEDFLNSNFSP